MMNIPVATRAPAVAAEAFGAVSEAQWKEAARYAILFHGTRATQFVALAVAGLFAIVAFGHVSDWALALWLAASLLLSAWRYWIGGRFERDIARLPVDEQLEFARRHTWGWVWTAAVWGLAPLLFQGRLTPEKEVMCWLLMAGVGGVAIAWMSAHHHVTALFLTTFLGCTALSVTAYIVTSHVKFAPAALWLPMLVLIYLMVLFRLASDLSKLYEHNINLRYKNLHLIESLKQQTLAAEQGANFKQRFLVGAAHDLKQPVSALGFYAEWLRDWPELGPELGPKILRSTRAINLLFDSLFDLAKLDAGEFAMNPRRIDVVELLAELEVQFRPMAMENGLQLRMRARPATLESDPVMLRRILGNLVANALRYTARGGVLVAARARAAGVLFEVWDTGVGIAPNEQALVFEEFHKVETPGTQAGFGLGLAIVQRLAARLDYRVAMRSVPGRGTVFRVWTAPQRARSSLEQAVHPREVQGLRPAFDAQAPE